MKHQVMTLPARILAPFLVTMLLVGCGDDATTNTCDCDDAAKMPSDGLVAHYTFDGTANDRTSNAFHGTVVGNVTFVPGRTTSSGQAAQFDGVRGHIAVSNVAGSKLEPKQGITIAAWVHANAGRGAEDWCHFVTKADAFDNGYVLKWTHDGSEDLSCFLITGANPASFSTPNDYLGTPNASLVGAWHHVAVTWSSITKRMAIFVDGTERAFKENCIYDGAHSGSTLYIGGHPYRNALNQQMQSTFPGAIDDVRIYERALNQSEIAKLAGEHI